LLEAYAVEEKGRPRRYYRLTDDGQAMLARELQAWASYAQAVNLVLEGAS
jgi:DNA-binding PadR family transcriptional regulator